MTRARREQLKKTLQAKEAELSSVLRHRARIYVDRTADELDQIQLLRERDMAVESLSRESELLRQVRAAMRRLEEGSFGICLECEEEIQPKRLAAVPWTANCIGCQESLEREGIKTPCRGEPMDNLLTAAL